MGMKCKKAFEPKTTKPSPSSTRAMMVRIFMSGQSGSIRRKIQSRIVKTDQFVNSHGLLIIIHLFLTEPACPRVR
jgi:hypothetical protein